MKSIMTIVLTLVVSGCATTGGGGLFDPEIVSGNERYVTVYDAIGLPGKAQQKAGDHCRSYGRIAQYQSQGGDSWQCGGRARNLCSTYVCVQ